MVGQKHEGLEAQEKGRGRKSEGGGEGWEDERGHGSRNHTFAADEPSDAQAFLIIHFIHKC